MLRIINTSFSSVSLFEDTKDILALTILALNLDVKASYLLSNTLISERILESTLLAQSIFAEPLGNI